jgi:hypothetical protein
VSAVERFESHFCHTHAWNIGYATTAGLFCGQPVTYTYILYYVEVLAINEVTTRRRTRLRLVVLHHQTNFIVPSAPPTFSGEAHSLCRIVCSSITPYIYWYPYMQCNTLTPTETRVRLHLDDDTATWKGKQRSTSQLTLPTLSFSRSTLATQNNG